MKPFNTSLPLATAVSFKQRTTWRMRVLEDANNGTSYQSWQTIAKVNSMMAGMANGSTINILNRMIFFTGQS